jgi:thiol-disulfide isomerase/thioredoxin
VKAFVGIILSLALMASLATAAAGELLPYEEQSEPPALNLPDLGGRQHDLASYRGQVVLVNFWASWCPPCLAEMPSMQRLATALKDKPFRLLAVNVKESRSKAWKFMKLLKVNFTALLDSRGEAAEAWNVQIYPTSYLIDAEGRVRYVAYGPVEWDSQDIIQRIEALLPGGKAVQQTKRKGG